MYIGERVFDVAFDIEKSTSNWLKLLLIKIIKDNYFILL